MNKHHAHTLDGRPEDEWEPLEVHLAEVERRARAFAAAFGAGDLGAAAGRWHDLGKYSREFQSYIRGGARVDGHVEDCRGRVNHSSAGAQHAAAIVPDRTIGRLLAGIIAGHHAGLPNFTGVDGGTSLDLRLADRKIPAWNDAPASVRALPGPCNMPDGWTVGAPDLPTRAFRLAFIGRLVFSALVDADFLATEAFCDPERADRRAGPTPTLRDLAPLLRAHLEKLSDEAAAGEVNRRRRAVLEACRAAAVEPPGHFSLTVPTGLGKTLSALAFAVEHALAHGLERVIVAIPFTSIIEQTAAVYREVFESLGAGAVLEHHSQTDPEATTHRARLATENWDAPLVVTTNVQLFESLFASKTSRCRKLHRLARSVIVLDEVQTLPSNLLAPCLAALRELVASARSTLLYCTATQPALGRREGFDVGLEGVREIIPDPAELYASMRRVDVELLGPLADEPLAERLRTLPQVLCIVNTRPHAARLFERLAADDDPEGTFHLSTWMCGAHRGRVIAEIRARLKEGRRCRVISTQLIEAGVDLDFPIVYRALAGIDSIAQAAGRCNREGRRPRGESKTFVFEPTEFEPMGLLAENARRSREVIAMGERFATDLLAPEAVEAFFRLQYWSRKAPTDNWDSAGVMRLLAHNPGKPEYAAAAEKFRLIEDVGRPVTIPWGPEGHELTEQLRPERLEPRERAGLRRKLQRYQVPIFERQFKELLAQGRLHLLHDEWAVLEGARGYDDRLGLRLDAEPEILVV